MTDNMIELAKRAVACKGWHWRCGMLISDGAWFSRVGSGYNWKNDAELLPDLTDPATLGCLLAMVRVAYSDPWFYVRPSDTYRPDGALGWECFGYRLGRDGGSWRGSGYASEAEALVAALEATP